MRLTTTAAAALAAVVGIGLPLAAPADAAHPGIRLTRHDVVRSSTLPSCAVEDASRGPVPCSWNFGTTDGNGAGLAYYVTGTHRAPRFHYVWATSPITDRWEWISRADADAMAEGGAEDATTRDWQACAVRFGTETTTVKCADGYRYKDRT